jgi:hypothetical protein
MIMDLLARLDGTLSKEALIGLSVLYLEDRGYEPLSNDGEHNILLGDLQMLQQQNGTVHILFICSESDAFSTWLRIFNSFELRISVSVAVLQPIIYEVLIWSRDAQGRFIPRRYRLTYEDFAGLGADEMDLEPSEA